MASRRLFQASSNAGRLHLRRGFRRSGHCSPDLAATWVNLPSEYHGHSQRKSPSFTRPSLRPFFKRVLFLEKSAVTLTNAEFYANQTGCQHQTPEIGRASCRERV